MIIVKLKGGMGNQMFQYAAARALALEKNTWVYLDPSFLYADAKGRWTQRSYALDAFNIQYKYERSGRINFLRRLNHSRFWQKMSDASWWPFAFRSFKEADPKFHPEVFSYPRNTNLEGYFQSEQYFIKHADQIRKDFALLEEPKGENATALEKIRSCESVSVHVRRGDYAALSAANSFHGLLDPSYYSRAADHLADATKKQLSFFVFSDDPSWTKRNIPLPGETIYVDWNSVDQAAEDLRLMSACKHHIIANSSLSWWGAWLNPRKDKIVLTPAKWFADPALDDRDIIPKEWIRMEYGPKPG